MPKVHKVPKVNVSLYSVYHTNNMIVSTSAHITVVMIRGPNLIACAAKKQ